MSTNGCILSQDIAPPEMTFKLKDLRGLAMPPVTIDDAIDSHVRRWRYEEPTPRSGLPAEEDEEFADAQEEE